jgi:2-polyprenyl-3-methyl-5-hydroxy-6-metoxy-1,4-benzoquinol methylase
VKVSSYTEKNREMVTANATDAAIAVFDGTAERFAFATDQQIATGTYLRGDIFMLAAVSSVPALGDILDYGCGPGRISAILARCGFRVRGFDTSPSMIAIAQSQSLSGLDVEFRTGGIHTGAAPQSAYDAVVCSSVIEYVTEAEKLLRWFHNALRPSGVLIISFAVSSAFRSYVLLRNSSDYIDSQKHTWNWRQFRALLNRTDFTPVRKPIYFDSYRDKFTWLRSPWGAMLGLVISRQS